jgi:hypothetical protein
MNWFRLKDWWQGPGNPQSATPHAPLGQHIPRDQSFEILRNILAAVDDIKAVYPAVECVFPEPDKQYIDIYLPAIEARDQYGQTKAFNILVQLHYNHNKQLWQAQHTNICAPSALETFEQELQRRRREALRFLTATSLERVENS